MVINPGRVPFLFSPLSTDSAKKSELKEDPQLNIGLLIPEKNALAAKQGAELAIREANVKGGYRGCPYHLVTRPTDGFWGIGSIQSVNLVFEDHVLAFIGALDGRNAHLAEQVATKTKVAFISAWATDMTLSYAFVPWFFRCIPDDKQQATALVQEIYRKRKIKNVVLIGTETYDSRYAINSFKKVCKSLSIPEPKQYLYKSNDHNFDETLLELENSGVEAIVLFGKPPLASNIIPLLKQRNIPKIIFGTLSIMDSQKELGPDWNILENVIIVSSVQWFTKKGLAFQNEFQKVYGYQPGPVAAYAYDGINVIVEAIKEAGPDREKIIDSLSKINYSGITGKIQFDKKGNRTGKVGLMKINNGKPLIID